MLLVWVQALQKRHRSQHQPKYVPIIECLPILLRLEKKSISCSNGAVCQSRSFLQSAFIPVFILFVLPAVPGRSSQVEDTRRGRSVSLRFLFGGEEDRGSCAAHLFPIFVHLLTLLVCISCSLLPSLLLSR